MIIYFSEKILYCFVDYLQSNDQKPIIVFCTVDPIRCNDHSLSIVVARFLGRWKTNIILEYYFVYFAHKPNAVIMEKSVNCYRDIVRRACWIKPLCRLGHTKYRVINQCRNFSFLRCVYIILCSYVVNDESHQIWNYFWTS